MKKRVVYAVIFILLFIVETLIALFIHDDFIRPYVGDIIVVWVVYCFVQLILGGKNSYAVACGTMIFAFGVEFLQKMRIVDVLGIENAVLRTIIGTSYATGDLICYAVGMIICFAGILVYRKIKKKQ